MSSTTCGFCGRYSHMTAHWAQTMTASINVPGGGGTIHGTAIQAVATCDNCGRSSMGMSDSPGSGGKTHAENFERSPDSSIEWYPRVGVSPEFPDVPESIAAAAKEAHSASSINCPMAAILMTRTVVEATAKNKDITSGSLFSKIDALETAGFIRPSTKDAAHEIRHLGNDMAHGDIDDRPTAEDAHDVLELMNEVLSEVFQGPAKTARIKAKRSTK